MKRLLISLPFLLLSLTLSAQTMSVVCGQVTDVFTVSDEEMIFATDPAAGQILTVQGKTYTIGEITNISVGSTPMKAATVDVVYSGSKASVTVSGDVARHVGVAVSGADVTISQGEELATPITYNLSGSSTDGSFNLGGKLKANITLNSLTLTSAKGAPVNITNGKHMYIEVNGTNNFADCASGDQKAAFFCNGHATFSGSGTLNLTGNTKHAYRSDEFTEFGPDFKGTVNVLKAVDDAFNVQQYLKIDNGTFNIENIGGDAFDIAITNDSTDLFNGQAFINGGTIKTTQSAFDTEGIKTDSLLTVTGGSINMMLSGDLTKGLRAGTDLRMTGGNVVMYVTGGYIKETLENGKTDTHRCHGIKTLGDFYMLGGSIMMSVTGAKAKGITVGGVFYYNGKGTYNVMPTAGGGFVPI